MKGKYWCIWKKSTQLFNLIFFWDKILLFSPGWPCTPGDVSALPHETTVLVWDFPTSFLVHGRLQCPPSCRSMHSRDARLLGSETDGCIFSLAVLPWSTSSECKELGYQVRSISRRQLALLIVNSFGLKTPNRLTQPFLVCSSSLGASTLPCVHSGHSLYCNRKLFQTPSLFPVPQDSLNKIVQVCDVVLTPAFLEGADQYRILGMGQGIRLGRGQWDVSVA